MLKRIVSIIVFLFIGTIAFAAGPFKWTHVGGDPCNPKAGCTLKWALGKTEWPSDVQLGLLVAVKGTTPETITITSGLSGSTKEPAWRGWMTFGKYKPKFEVDAIAAWKDGSYQPALHWFLDRDHTRYHLMKVRKCGNWGGWKEVRPTVIEVVRERVATVVLETPEPSQLDMPLGTIPVVVCL